MRLSIVPPFFLALAGIVYSTAVEPRDLLQELRHQAIASLRKAETYTTGTNTPACSLKNAAVRKDWASLSPDDRKSYINAVQCLVSSPSQLNRTAIPGARTRYDDFVATHINQTLSIHGTGNFLAWHRYYVHAYETALRDECGYKGVTPYWNWFAHTDDLRKSPVFDGSETSLGSDGEFVAHNGSLAGGGTIPLPSGEGGGCIARGPFRGLQANLGPVSPGMAGETKVPSPLAYNPRCLKRDLSAYAASKWLTTDNLYNLTVGPASTSLLAFQNELQGRFSDGFLGLHATGHFAIGGDAGDFYSSPADPVFFLHHAMLDRVWWVWQALHPREAKSVAGTITLLNRPPSRNATLEDVLGGFGWLGMEEKTIGGVVDTLGGEGLCYIYE